MNADHNRPADGWPDDERPIFIDAGFGTIAARHPDPARPLTAGTIVAHDAAPETFADAWATIIAEEPGPGTRWEYAVQAPGEVGPTGLRAAPLGEALEQVRTTPGARLRRRPIGEWEVVETPFPREERIGWGELEAEKASWHDALNEFPPSYGGVISRHGGVDHAPEEWTQFARRAAAAGFTPEAYRMLGTARAAASARTTDGALPSLQTIELWAEFPALVAGGTSLLGAISTITRRLQE